MDTPTEDAYLLSFLHSFIRDRFNTLNVYKSLSDIQVIQEKWSQATTEFVRPLFNNRLSMYVLYDVDVGVVSSIPKSKVNELISIGKLDAGITVHLRYLHGNIYSFILQEDIDESLLLTDKTYVLRETASGAFYHAKIGSYSSPNNLYLEARFDGLEVPLSKTLPVDRFRNYSIISRDDLVLNDIPH